MNILRRCTDLLVRAFLMLMDYSFLFRVNAIIKKLGFPPITGNVIRQDNLHFLIEE
jgi:hypothetical protein